MGKSKDLRNPNSLRSKFRKKRIKHLVRVINQIIKTERLTTIKICDLGGSFLYWNFFPFENFADIKFEITLVNISKTRMFEADKFSDSNQVIFLEKLGDACNLVDVENNEYHLCHSNSVIEHVGDWARIKKMTDEALRIAKYHFIQTPNYWFPVEPHHYLPFIHFLPRPTQTRLLMWIRKKFFDDATTKFDEIRMLSKNEFSFFFPNSKFIKERYL